MTGDTANRRTGELGNSRYRQFRELPIRSLSSGNKLKPLPEGTGCREVHRMYRVGSGVLNQRHGGGCGIKAALSRPAVRHVRRRASRARGARR